MVIGLDHVQLAAPPGCEQAARDYYGALLGLEEIPKPEPLRSRGGVWFRCGPHQQLHVGVEDPHRPAGKAHPALAVRAGALQQLAERLAAAGAPVDWDTSLESIRRFHSRDPWGNRIELLEAAAPGG